MFRKYLFSLISLWFIISGSVFTQEIDRYGRAKEDYKDAVIVAHVQVKSSRIVDQEQLYAKRFVSAQIKESFKGNREKGQMLEYYEQEERDSSSVYPNEAIVFLKSSPQERTNKKKELWGMFNSTRTYTKENISIMRKIKSSSKKQTLSYSH